MQFFLYWWTYFGDGEYLPCRCKCSQLCFQKKALCIPVYTMAEAELKQSNQSATGYFEYLHEWLLCDVNHSVEFHLEVNGMFVDGSEKRKHGGYLLMMAKPRRNLTEGSP